MTNKELIVLLLQQPEDAEVIIIVEDFVSDINYVMFDINTNKIAIQETESGN